MQKLEHESMAQAVAVKMKTSEEEVLDIQHRVRTSCSRDSFINDWTDTLLRDVREDAADLLPDKTINEGGRRTDLIAWVKELSEKVQSGSVARVGLKGDEAKALVDFSRERGVTREQVRQSEMPALVRLRNTIKRKIMTQKDLR